MNYYSRSLLLISIFMYCYIVSGEYRISEGHVPQYLYHKFDNLQDDIFRYDIRINVSLSSIRGTLLYSIDRNRNQLIVSLVESTAPALKIEFRGQRNIKPLSEICQCTLCQYEILDLIVQVMSRLQVQCNGHRIWFINYGGSNRINEDYPNPYPKNINISKYNEAHMWIVNHPQYGDIYPNPKQLSGCIFSVRYNSHNVVFTNISGNINRKCTPACTVDVCNGGQCLETYSQSPVCNCTSTFRNGPYCNDTMTSMNIRSNEQNFIFESVKVSWKSFNSEILRLDNKHGQLHVRTNGTNVSMDCNYINGLVAVKSKAILSSKYIFNTESILIVDFKDTFVDVKFHNNGSWTNVKVPTNIDLRREIFESMTLTSGTGTMDIVYKDDGRHVIWMPLFISDPSNFTEVSLTPSVTDHRKEKVTIRVLSNGIVFLMAMMNSIITLICFLITKKCGKRLIVGILRKRHQNHDQNQRLLSQTSDS